jgi:Carbohydrate binding module (family 6)
LEVVAMGESAQGSGFKWLVGVLVAILAAGSGIVALLNYFNPQDEEEPTGGQQIATSRVEGENFSESSSGVQTDTVDGVRFLGYLTDGAWTTYSTPGMGSGTVDAILARVASASDGGAMFLRVEGKTGAQIGECQVPGTGSWTTWQNIQCDVQGEVPSGSTHLYLEFKGVGNPYLFNVDWVELR